MIDAILGRINVFGAVIEFTRQEAAIVYCLIEAGPSGCTAKMMISVIFSKYSVKSGKTLGVHMCNIRKKLPSNVEIKFDAVKSVYKIKGE